MATGDGPNAAVEFLYKLSLRKDFLNDIQRARTQLELPLTGLPDEGMRLKWLARNKSKTLDLLAIELTLLRKYKISIAFRTLLSDYIFLAEQATKDRRKDPVAVIERYDRAGGGLEELYAELGEPFVKLLIFGNGSKQDVLRFVKENWDVMDDILLEQRGEKRKRMRETRNKERNKTIRELCRKTKSELEKIAGQRSAYKEFVVQAILKARGYGDVSDGYIRKICAGK